MLKEENQAADKKWRQHIIDNGIRGGLGEARQMLGRLRAELERRHGVFALLKEPAAWQRGVDLAQQALQYAWRVEAATDIPIEPALRTRTRKVAWKASSASAAFPNTRRQTPSTIGPCRRTNTVNASSSRRAT